MSGSATTGGEPKVPSPLNVAASRMGIVIRVLGELALLFWAARHAHVSVIIVLALMTFWAEILNHENALMFRQAGKLFGLILKAIKKNTELEEKIDRKPKPAEYSASVPKNERLAMFLRSAIVDSAERIGRDHYGPPTLKWPTDRTGVIGEQTAIIAERFGLIIDGKIDVLEVLEKFQKWSQEVER